ncbi:MAG: protein translocase subunit SecF [Chloroflexota bacterium]
MFQLVQRRRLYFIFSGIIISIGIAMMIYSTSTTGAPFLLGIDFSGGSIYEFGYDETVEEQQIRDVFATLGQDSIILQRIGSPEDNRWSVRAGVLDEGIATTDVIDALDTIATVDRDATRFEEVSPTIGSEVTRSALFAVATASVVVTVFIVSAFRKIPNALRYGLSAIAAMVHDVMIMLGIVSFAGVFFGWEVDALFLTAVLTVVGFSVQDSIVVFDRIRENIPKYLGEPYETIVNRSVLETIHRSLATQLNAFFVMAAILLFGGPSVKQFIAILFIGLLSGTYSSIFIAVPLLVAWEKGEIPGVSGGYNLEKREREAARA